MLPGNAEMSMSPSSPGEQNLQSSIWAAAHIPSEGRFPGTSPVSETVGIRGGPFVENARQGGFYLHREHGVLK